MQDKVKITFLGDLMCEGPMLSAYKLSSNKYNFDSIFAPTKDFLQRSDYVFANLETPISVDNTNLTNEQYRFNTPFEFASAIRNAGINFVATANNHCLDRDILGIDSTIKSLDNAGILHTGTYSKKQKKYSIIEVKGIKFGILAYTYGTNAFANNIYLKKRDLWRVNLFQNQELSFFLDQFAHRNPTSIFSKLYTFFLHCKKSTNINKAVYERQEFNHRCRKDLLNQIKLLKEEKPDFIIMLMHTGGQYNAKASPQTQELVSFLQKNDIDIIAGSHEHVVHGIAFNSASQNKIAAYSLGNFVNLAGSFNEPFNKHANYSIAWNIYLKKNSDSTSIDSISYTILKTIPDDKPFKVKTALCFDLYRRESNCNKKESLWKDMQFIAKRFSNQEVEEPLEEYFIDLQS